MMATSMMPAAAEMVETHQVGVWRYLRFLGCDEARADDLTQEVFFVALTKPFNYENRNQATVWLRRVARNLFLADTRRRNREITLEDLDAREEVFAVQFGADDGEGFHEALRRCLEQVPERSRLALSTFYGGDSRQNAAVVLGMTEEALKKLLFRLRQALRDCIERRRANA
jgi:RNA polymerase sigma-70 factor (ECF subfamily)